MHMCISLLCMWIVVEVHVCTCIYTRDAGLEVGGRDLRRCCGLLGCQASWAVRWYLFAPTYCMSEALPRIFYMLTLCAGVSCVRLLFTRLLCGADSLLFGMYVYNTYST
jgi:hypothetical protein